MDGVLGKHGNQRADQHAENPVKGDLAKLHAEIIADIDKFPPYGIKQFHAGHLPGI